jgi:catechol 2,3-dioxygenase-like lactoylglutathione lyase family enzyme
MIRVKDPKKSVHFYTEVRNCLYDDDELLTGNTDSWDGLDLQ